MNLVPDQRAETTVYQLVPCKRPLALELLGDDECLEMVIVVARDANRGIIEARGDQFFYLGGFHLAVSISYCPGGAQFNRKTPGIPMRKHDCV